MWTADLKMLLWNLNFNTQLKLMGTRIVELVIWGKQLNNYLTDLNLEFDVDSE